MKLSLANRVIYDKIKSNTERSELLIDVYDFDKTVVPYDSAMKFWHYCLLRRPQLLLILPFQIFWSLLALCRIISVPTYKKGCFRFVRLICTKKTVEKFWDRHEKDVYPFFLPQNRDPSKKTVVISASPYFLISEIARRLDVDYCIATDHDEKSGKLLGEVCRRDQKVARLKALLPDAQVDSVYSDSLEHDRFIFALGKNKYLAHKGELTKLLP